MWVERSRRWARASRPRTLGRIELRSARRTSHTCRPAVVTNGCACSGRRPLLKPPRELLGHADEGVGSLGGRAKEPSSAERQAASRTGTGIFFFDGR
jgi:hypothetical protein